MFAAVSQTYNTETHNEYIVLGNDALIKCSVPSFVTDFVTVSGWVDSEGNSYHSDDGLGNYMSSPLTQDPSQMIL